MGGIKVSRVSQPAAVDVPARPLCAFADVVAHTPARRGGPWHLLGDHLRGVGELAGDFAAPFGGQDVARLAGYLHDAGKAVDEVQRRFRQLGFQDGRTRSRLGVPHKVEGAMLMSALLGGTSSALGLAGYLMNYGHHSGIPARSASTTVHDVLASRRRPESLTPLAQVVAGLTGKDLDSLVRACVLPPHVAESVEAGSLTHLELFTRMCHSALVDADFLDTAAHFSGDAEVRLTQRYGLAAWLRQFEEHHADRFGTSEPSELNAVRSTVHRACVEFAVRDLPPGIYRLPAPTGTGKTMASAAFALHHAVRFGKERIIVAVPFTTITTQNAAAYREAFGPLGSAVLEHHSNVVDDAMTDESWHRLSSPGWDAEFIVTTTVQLFESLFANRPARTRKLHRLVDSVLVLDEVQALPIDLLGPILGVLRELVEHYGVTVLLASATQPTFWSLPVWSGLPVHDILPVDSAPDVTQRVVYEVRGTPQGWEALAREVQREHQVLMIENRRADADELYAEVASARGTDDTFLLSKSMTADHRDRVLATVRSRLSAGRSVAVVSTQLIEAGVDIDFPLVYRALAPAESVVQAAGRCNREGRLGARGGRVVVHVPEAGDTPPGMYTVQTNITRDRFVRGSKPAAFDSAPSLAEYFDDVYRSTEPQRHERETTLSEHRRSMEFPELARDFQMIRESSVDVVVTDHPDPDVRAAISAAIEELRANPLEPLTRGTRRLLQRHSAAISRRDLGLTVELSHGVRVWSGMYDPQRGVVANHALTW